MSEAKPTRRALSSHEEDVDSVMLTASPSRALDHNDNHFSANSPEIPQDVKPTRESRKEAHAHETTASYSRATAAGALEEMLQCSVKLDMGEIRSLAFRNVGEKQRPTVWKLLLHYLPNHTETWQEHLQKQREAYREFIQDVIPLPKSGDETMDQEIHLDRLRVKEEGFVDLDETVDEEESKKRERERRQREGFRAALEKLGSPAEQSKTDYKTLFGVRNEEDEESDASDTRSPIAKAVASPAKDQSALFDSSDSDSEDEKNNGSAKNDTDGIRKALFGYEDSKNDCRSKVEEATTQSASVSGCSSNIQTNTTSSTHDPVTTLKDSTSTPSKTNHNSQQRSSFTSSSQRQSSQQKHCSHLSRESVSNVFDPLSTDPDNTWCNYFSDANLRNQISKDVLRTHPTLQFFQKKAIQKIMNRILFLFAKLNPGVGYVQGMNELAAPLLYVIATEDGISLEDAEADTFYVFTALMAEMRDVFIRDNDRSVDGLAGVMENLRKLIRTCEPTLASHLGSMGVEPDIYAFRWLTTLLAREFDMADTIQLWDRFFADPDRFQFTLHCCVAMMRIYHEELLRGDFGDCIHLLQELPPVDIHTLIQTAIDIRKEAKRKLSFQKNEAAGEKTQERRAQDALKNQWNVSKSAIADALKELKRKGTARNDFDNTGREPYERQSSFLDHSEDEDADGKRNVVTSAKRAANVVGRALVQPFKQGSSQGNQDQELREISKTG